MFKNLPASSGTRRGVVTGKTATVSIILHAILLTAAVYATVGMTAEERREEELVEFLEIEEQEEIEEEETPPPPPPEETPPPPPPVPQTAVLEPPMEAPPQIPEVDLSAPPVTAQDFTGIGQAGDVAIIAPPAPPGPPPEEAAPGPAFAYEVAVLSRPPRLNNASTVASVMERLYPRMLQDAGIGGTVIVQFVIEANGTVDMSSIQIIESPHEQLSNATRQALDRFRFTPGQYNRQNVRVLTQMPITWQPQR
jgi:periplasmic protein TonB